jgi:hypothetical protein
MKTAVSPLSGSTPEDLDEEMVDVKTKIEPYSNAAVFVCPSIYEPFGIINGGHGMRNARLAAAVGTSRRSRSWRDRLLVSIDQMQRALRACG